MRAFFESIVRTVNSYFIEMVKNDQARAELAYRLTLPVEERQLYTLPETREFSDALYVSVGCRFQDNPFGTLIIIFLFLLAIGFTAANLITRFL